MGFSVSIIIGMMQAKETEQMYVDLWRLVC